MDKVANEGKIIIGFPGEPEDVALAIIKDTVNFMSANHGIEMTYSHSTFEGHKAIMLEAMRPDDWNEDRVRQFIAFVAQTAMQISAKHVTGHNDEGEEWKSGENGPE
jgi:tRNA A37 methylthiotransferase MiaB